MWMEAVMVCIKYRTTIVLACRNWGNPMKILCDWGFILFLNWILIFNQIWTDGLAVTLQTCLRRFPIQILAGASAILAEFSWCSSSPSGKLKYSSMIAPRLFLPNPISIIRLYIVSTLRSSLNSHLEYSEKCVIRVGLQVLSRNW
jgi:hypothetical protein